MPRPPLLAASTRGLTARVFSELAARARAHEGPVYPLHVGDTWRRPPEAAWAEHQSIELPGLHNYAPVPGLPRLREVIAERMSARVGRPIEVDRIQVTSGATTGLSVLAETLLDPGDEVLLPSPFWPLIRGIIQSKGAVPVEVPVMDRLGELELEAVLEAAVTDRTVAVYVNTPHNPTGAILSRADVAAIVAVAERHDLWVISDEAYETLWFEGDRPAPLWDEPALRDRVISAHTLSKSHGLAGARVGWLQGPPEAIAALRDVFTYHSYNAPTPMQHAAIAALTRGEDWVVESRSLYAALARRAADALGVPAPAGGTFLFVDARPHFREGEDLLAFLGRCVDAGVLLTPGTASGVDYDGWVRLCFTSVAPDELDAALEALGPLFA